MGEIHPDKEAALEFLEDDLIGFGEFNTVDHYGDHLVVELHPASVEALDVGDMALYDTVSEARRKYYNGLDVDESEIENKKGSQGTDAHGNPRVPALKYRIE